MKYTFITLSLFSSRTSLDPVAMLVFDVMHSNSRDRPIKLSINIGYIIAILYLIGNLWPDLLFLPSLTYNFRQEMLILKACLLFEISNKLLNIRHPINSYHPQTNRMIQGSYLILNI